MTALDLVLLSISWSALRSMHDLDARVSIASSLISTDANDQELRILMRLAYTESNYSDRVAKCKRGTVRGHARGTWQIVPRDAEQWRDVCGFGSAAALVALWHVRESLQICAALPERERLAIYTRGSCKSREGRALSRERILP